MRHERGGNAARGEHGIDPLAQHDELAHERFLGPAEPVALHAVTLGDQAPDLGAVAHELRGIGAGAVQDHQRLRDVGEPRLHVVLEQRVGEAARLRERRRIGAERGDEVARDGVQLAEQGAPHEGEIGSVRPARMRHVARGRSRRGRGCGGRFARRFIRRRARCGREPEREARAFSLDALHHEVAAHEPREPAGDRESESRTAVRARVAAVSLHERLKDPLEKPRRDPDPRVPHGDVRPRSARCRLVFLGGLLEVAAVHADATRRGRELHGVREEVDEDLLHAVLVTEVEDAAQRIEIGDERDPLRRGLWAHERERGVHRRGGARGGARHLEPPRFDA